VYICNAKKKTINQNPGIFTVMEKKSILINSIFAVCIVALFILHFVDKPKNEPFLVSSSDSTAVYVKLPIAYVNVDTLLMEYNYSKDLNETLTRKRENAQATLTQKARQLETEMAEFQRKYENNAFLSETSFKNQQQRLAKKQEDLQKLENNLTQQLMEEQQAMNKTLRDTVYNFLARYNADKKFQLILSNTMNDNIMMSEPAYNITGDVVKALNKSYTPKED
jgi:outer membrane protein